MFPLPLALWLSVFLATGKPPEVTASYAADLALGARWIELRFLDGSTLVAMETEVTRAHWQAVMGTSPRSPCEQQDCPIEDVTPFSMMAFANRLSEIEGLDPCYELPACWDHAPDKDFGCEAPGQRPECTGYRAPTWREWATLLDADPTTEPRDEVDLGSIESINSPARRAWLERRGWFAGNSNLEPHPVAQKLPNTWGFFDLLGNVEELVTEAQRHPFGFRPPNPIGVDPTRLGAAGCRYYSSPLICSDIRSGGAAVLDMGGPGLGLRLVRSISP